MVIVKKGGGAKLARFLFSPLLSFLSITFLCGLLFLGAPYLWPLPYEVTMARGNQDYAEKGTSSSFNASHEEALRRPVFHVNRRPPQEIIERTVAPTPVRIEAPFELVGVLGGTGGQLTAYLQNKSTGETNSVRVGQKIEDWRVDKVGQDFVALVMGDERRVVQLSGGE